MLLHLQSIYSHLFAMALHYRVALRHIHIFTQTQTRHAGPRQMRMNAKNLLVQRLPHKRTSKCSAGHSLAVRMNVCPHQYDCECIFLWSTDSRRIAFACSPNIHRISERRRMLFAYMSTLCVSHACSCTDVDAALHVCTYLNGWWTTSHTSYQFCHKK